MSHSILCYLIEPSVLNIGTGIFLILGTTISYIPQYVSIIRRKSSEGLDFIMLSFALMSTFLTAINSGILKWPQVICCLSTPLGQCLKNNLATDQLLVSLICYLILYILFLVYCKTDADDLETEKHRKKIKFRALICFIGIICLSAILATVGGVLFYHVGLTTSTLAKYAQVLGGFSAVLMIIQWTPQIYTTWKMNSAGSLSVIMLLLQMPGALLVVFFQGILNASDWTTWLPYIFGAVEMTILIVLCIYYWLRERSVMRVNTSETEHLLQH